jgi:hypothetical protein
MLPHLLGASALQDDSERAVNVNIKTVRGNCSIQYIL